MKNNKKGFGIFGIIITVAIIVVIAGGTIYITNTNSSDGSESESSVSIIDHNNQIENSILQKQNELNLRGVKPISLENKSYGELISEIGDVLGDTNISLGDRIDYYKRVLATENESLILSTADYFVAVKDCPREGEGIEKIIRIVYDNLEETMSGWTEEFRKAANINLGSFEEYLEENREHWENFCASATDEVLDEAELIIDYVYYSE